MRLILILGLLGCSSKSAADRAEAELRKTWSPSRKISCRETANALAECIVDEFLHYRCVVSKEVSCERL